MNLSATAYDVPAGHSLTLVVDTADPLYQRFVSQVEEQQIPVATGRFQAHMDVELVNDGPVTILLDSQRSF